MLQLFFHDRVSKTMLNNQYATMIVFCARSSASSMALHHYITAWVIITTFFQHSNWNQLSSWLHFLFLCERVCWEQNKTLATHQKGHLGPDPTAIYRPPSPAKAKTSSNKAILMNELLPLVPNRPAQVHFSSSFKIHL